MKQFWKDYGNLCKETNQFYKKHWKGVIILNAVIIGVECLWLKRKLDQLDFECSIDKEEEAQ